MHSHRDDPSWQHYADTVLHFADGPSIDLRLPVRPQDADALRALGIAAPFAVVTAYNPGGVAAPAAQNERRHSTLHADVRLRDPDCRVATGASPDGVHREPGVAARLTLDDARALACRYEQSAFFWFDGERFWIRGARVETPPVPLPLQGTA